MNAVAVIFDNFGPYHVARLEAAASTCNLLAIEVAARSSTYAWDSDASSAKFQKETLVQRETSEGVPSLELYRRISKALEKFQPTVVAVPGWASPAAWSALSWCLQHRVPMVCMSESTAWDEPRSAWKEMVKKRLLSLCPAALVGGTLHRDYLVQLGVAADHVFYGYDSVDNGYFAAAADIVRADSGARHRLGLPAHYILASARFVGKKNLSRLLEAYSAYRSRQAEPWSLVLLGDGELRTSLTEQRDALDLQNDVVMPGFVQYPDLPAYYALASAFIHASTIEPWGLVVNEAAASGLPLLVSNRCGCAPELVREGKNGFTFDPLDVSEITGQMEKISAPDFPRSAFGRASREIAAQWAPSRFAGGLNEAVAAALRKGPVRSRVLDRALLAILLHR